MSRRVSKAISAVFALTLFLSAPSAFAGRRSPTFDDPAGPIDRIVRIVKKFVRGFVPVTNEEFWPTPPKP